MKKLLTFVFMAMFFGAVGSQAREVYIDEGFLELKKIETDSKITVSAQNSPLEKELEAIIPFIESDELVLLKTYEQTIQQLEKDKLFNKENLEGLIRVRDMSVLHIFKNIEDRAKQKPSEGDPLYKISPAECVTDNDKTESEKDGCLHRIRDFLAYLKNLGIQPSCDEGVCTAEFSADSFLKEYTKEFIPDYFLYQEITEVKNSQKCWHILEAECHYCEAKKLVSLSDELISKYPQSERLSEIKTIREKAVDDFNQLEKFCGSCKCSE